MGRELSRLYVATLFDLSGHVAAVTGGSSGIGRSIALGLVQADLPSQFWRAMKRAHPDECAGAAAFLAFRDSDFVSGSTLVVDRGYAIR
jgi:NAD(P)-dependent dehydrogenase (short-subunit alcohol dehydrogenase family)